MPMTKEHIEKLLAICRYTEAPPQYVEALHDLLEARAENALLQTLLATREHDYEAAVQACNDETATLAQAQARITELEAELKAYQERFHRHDGPLDFVAEV